MKIQVKSFLHFVLFLIAAAAPITSQAATLDWDPSPTPDIAGYNVYYKKNTPTFPFDGSDLLEGASPIKVDGSQTTSLSLSLPEDGSMYYFTVTAFNEAGLESTYSNIVATDWFPNLIAPTDNAAINTVATFTWNRPPAYFKPSTYIVSFDLLYGTDPSLDVNGMTATANSSWPNPFNPNIVMTIAILLLLLMAIRSSQRTLSWHPIRVCFCIGVLALQVSCGGGGGGSDSDNVNSTTTPSTTIRARLSEYRFT